MADMKTLTLNNVTYDIVDVNAIHNPITAEVGQTIKVSAVDENGKPTAWEAADMTGGGGYKRNIETVTDITFDVDTDATSDFNVEDIVYGNNHAWYRSKVTGERFKIKRLWFEIFWPTGSKDACTATPTISIGRASYTFDFNNREQWIYADKGSISNNITDNNWYWGYCDWEKVMSEAFHNSNDDWRGVASNYSCYPSVRQVRFALQHDHADCVKFCMGGTIKAGMKLKIWVEVDR